METSSEILALISAVLLGVIGLFRDKEFTSLIRAALIKTRDPKDVARIEELEEQNRDLLKEREISAAIQAVIDEMEDHGNEGVKKAKAMQRLMRSHGKPEKKPSNEANS